MWKARDPGERDALLISGGSVQKANEYAEVACEAAVTIGQLLDPDAKRGRPTKNVLGLQHFEMPQLFSMLNICLVWKARDSGARPAAGAAVGARCLSRGMACKRAAREPRTKTKASSCQGGQLLTIINHKC